MARPKNNPNGAGSQNRPENQNTAAVADFQVVTNPESVDTGEVTPEAGEAENTGASVPAESADTFDYRAAYEAEKAKNGDLQALVAEITACNKNEIEKLQAENKRLQEAASEKAERHPHAVSNPARPAQRSGKHRRGDRKIPNRHRWADHPHAPHSG